MTRALPQAVEAARRGDGHASDCATHNMPASPNGPCDCGLAPIMQAIEAYRDAIYLAARDGDSWGVAEAALVAAIAEAIEQARRDAVRLEIDAAGFTDEQIAEFRAMEQKS